MESDCISFGCRSHGDNGETGKMSRSVLHSDSFELELFRAVTRTGTTTAKGEANVLRCSEYWDVGGPVKKLLHLFSCWRNHGQAKDASGYKVELLQLTVV